MLGCGELCNLPLAGQGGGVEEEDMVCLRREEEDCSRQRDDVCDLRRGRSQGRYTRDGRPSRAWCGISGSIRARYRKLIEFWELI
jgi:hypothetical protein